MFIRVRTSENTDVNLNLGQIRYFSANAGGEGSTVVFTDGSSMQVTDSTRSLRGYAKKALTANSDSSDEA